VRLPIGRRLPQYGNRAFAWVPFRVDRDKKPRHPDRGRFPFNAFHSTSHSCRVNSGDEFVTSTAHFAHIIAFLLVRNIRQQRGTLSHAQRKYCLLNMPDLPILSNSCFFNSTLPKKAFTGFFSTTSVNCILHFSARFVSFFIGTFFQI
jgi:hypothetical protein